jgi:MSHA pilin protein MshC
MVLVLLGVLAVFAAPRLATVSDFKVRGFHDQTLAYLRYAQKTAIAQRRTVCVTWTSGSIALGISSTPNTNNCDPSLALRGPRGESPASVSAPAGVTYASLPLALNFDGLGQPVDATTGIALTAARSLSVAGAPGSITVESVTGYVHE